jgi:hypothetical protein
MSISVMSKVWKCAPYSGGTLLTLLAMADWADDEGFCWPAVATLAKKTRQSLANTRNCTRRMETDGAVYIERRLGAGNRYRINVAGFEEIGKQKANRKSKRGGARGSKTGGGQTMVGSNTGDHPTKELHQTPPIIGDNTSVDTLLDTLGATAPVLFPEVPSKVDNLKIALEEVFHHYVAVIKKDPLRYKLTPERRKKGLQRLRQCLAEAKDGRLDNAVAIMKLAIDRLAASPIHNGHNDQHCCYLEWQTHLLRKDWEGFYDFWIDDRKWKVPQVGGNSL